MVSWRFDRAAASLTALWLAIANPTQSAFPRIVAPRPAAQYMTAAFGTHPLVAFSEPAHGASGTREFLASLIRYPGFAGTVNDIVIECGNSRYQDVADRYFAGEAIARDELKQIWDTSRRVVVPESLIHLLDRRFPNRTRVVHSVDRDQVSASVIAPLREWPSLFVLPVRDTWIGRSDVREVGHNLSRGVVEDDFDAVLFWDSTSSSTDGLHPGAGDASVSTELRHRQQLAEATLPFRGGKIRFEANRATLSAQSESALSAVLAELKRDVGLNLRTRPTRR